MTWSLVTRRELASRWILAPAALVIGTLAMSVISKLHLVRGDADALLTGTWIGTLVIAGLVGLSLVGDDLTNGRLSFYFTRPFSPGAIFGGKLIAGCVVAIGVEAIVLPAVAIGMPALGWQGSDLAAGGIAFPLTDVILATGASVVLGMAAGIVVRSKARWLVLDVLGIAIVGVAMTFITVHLEDAAYATGYAASVWLLQIGALVVAATGLAYATAQAVSRGRTDRERAHAALSRTLWPILVPASCVLLVATLSWF